MTRLKALGILFGGISLILLLHQLEEWASVKIPADRLLFYAPIDSLLVRDRQMLSSDRYNNPFSALSLDGKDDYLIMDAFTTNLKGDFSFCFWVNIRELKKSQTLFQKGENCPDGNADYKGMAYEILLSEEGFLSMRLFSIPGNYTDEYIEFISDESIPLHEWYLLVIQFNTAEKNFHCFLNNSPMKGRTLNRTSPANFTQTHQNKSPLKTGAEENYCKYIHTFDSFFSGQLDDIRIYSGLLSEMEMRLLYEAPESIFMKYKIAIIFLVLLFTFTVLHQRFAAPAASEKA